MIINDKYMNNMMTYNNKCMIRMNTRKGIVGLIIKHEDLGLVIKHEDLGLIIKHEDLGLIIKHEDLGLIMRI